MKKVCLVLIGMLFSFNLLAQELNPGDCGDGIDNDGDGLIDCFDGDCAGNLTACPAFDFSSNCSPTGGKRGDIIATEVAYRGEGVTTPATFTIPAGANRALVYITSVDDGNVGGCAGDCDEDFISVGAVLDLTLQTSSGYLNFADNTSTNGSGTQVFGWRDVAFGANVTTGALAGHDNTPTLNDLVFSVSGGVLTITETNTNIQSSYVVEFTSANITSMLANGFNNLFVDDGTAAANTDISIAIPASTSIITVTAKGVGAIEGPGGSPGGADEGFMNLRFSIDLDQGTAGILNGYITVANGGDADHHSTYVIRDHDLSNNTQTVIQAGAAIGDITGNETGTGGNGDVGMYEPRIYISGGNLIIERDAGYAEDFEDVYVIEHFRRINEPMGSEFIDSEILFMAEGTGSNGSVDGSNILSGGTTSDFTIPAGTEFIFFNMAGNANNTNTIDNENAAQAYAIIDLNSETANGYYFQQVGFSSGNRRDDNVAFANLPLDNTSVVKFAGSVGQDAGGGNEHYDMSFNLSADKRTITVQVSSGLVPSEYQYVLSMDYFGSKPDLTSEAAQISFDNTANCKVAEVEIEMFNPGAGNSPEGMPISFYDGDPTTNPNAILLASVPFGAAIAVGQRATHTFNINLSAYENINFDMTIILNDDGSFGAGVGNPIGTTFNLVDLENQNTGFIECDYTNNLVTQTTGLNNCPTVDLDGNEPGIDYNTCFAAGGTAVPIADGDVLVNDLDNDQIQSATITLTNRPDGDGNESLSVSGTLPAGITASAYNQSTGVITLSTTSGSPSYDDYETALQQIVYDNSIGSPNTTNRSVTISLNDAASIAAGAATPVATTTICILTTPEIDVEGNGNTIEDGSVLADATTADGTDFGLVTVSTTATQTFEISNIGTGNITLTPPVTSDNPQFTITTQPPTTTLSSGATTSFIVTFTTATPGTFSATISIANDDSDENPYTFTIRATANPLALTTPVVSCQNNDAFITIEGLAANTTSTLTFDLGAPNTVSGATASVTTDANGTGVFSVSGANLNNIGNTTITITAIDGNPPVSPLSATLDISPAATCFSCEPLFYQVISGELRPYQPLTGSYGAGLNNEPEYNALGFNIQDRLMYAIDRIDGPSDLFDPRDLMRILADGSLQNLGNVDISGNVIAADVDANDALWAVNPSDRTTLIRIPDLSTLPANASATITPETFSWSGIVPSPNGIADIVIINQVAYGLERDTDASGQTGMFIWDLTTLNRSRVVVSGFAANLPEGFGAAFTDLSNNMYFANNVGQLYSISDYTTSSPTANYLGPTDATTSNDGTSCPQALSPIDKDIDNILDPLDIDADNDGITNTDESGGNDPFADVDNDGVFAYLDANDNDAGQNTVGLNPAFDTDGDGIPNFFDLDSDNDGVYDVVEAGHGQADANNDGVIDGADTGSGDNGLFNPLESGNDTETATTTGVYTIADTDSDASPNFLDLDSDNDGIPDIIEAGGEDSDGNGLVDCFGTLTDPTTLTDTDTDGLCDTYDANNGGTSLGTPDTDGDGIPDYLDLDSDNDGIPDLVELGGEDEDGDGRVDTYVNNDNDGYTDIYDSDDDGTFGVEDPNDPIAEGSTTALTNGASTSISTDFDGDTRPNHLDIDSDNDGIVDVIESGGTDANNDGIIDGIADTDGDGFADAVDGDVGNDGTAENTANALIATGADTDADGRPNSYPNANTDGDNGNPDFLDIDSDNDGIVDNNEAQATSSYTTPTGTDTDGDGWDNAYDSNNGGTPITLADTDTDGTPDYQDTDSDNDTEPDQIEGHDTNGDGVADASSPANTGIGGAVDSDNDGLLDGFDNNTSAVNPTNGSLTPNSYPDFDGGGSERDWREFQLTTLTITTAVINCQDNDAVVTIEGLAASSTSTITFDLDAPNAVTGITATVSTNASGTGLFTVSGANLSNTGNTTITATQINGIALTTTVTATLNISPSSTCFSCDPLFYQVISGELRPYQPLTGTYGASINTPAEPNLNALGYNLRDRLMYALDRDNAGAAQTNDLVRMTGDGAIVVLGNVGAPGSFAGDVDGNDALWFHDGGQLYRVGNLSTRAAGAGSITPESFTWTGDAVVGTLADIAVIGNLAYGMSRSGGNTYLYTFDLVNHTRTRTIVTGFVSGSSGTFGAAFTDIDNNLYFSDNVGQLYLIEDYTTTPSAVYLGPTEVTSTNDGASCPLAASPIDKDNDSVLDPIDIDADNDGITNTDESGGNDPFADVDTDGIFAYLDADDNDAGQNTVGLNPAFDTDGDGIPNFFDLDSDNDGIYDVVEAGHGQADANNDGVIDGADIGSGDNGLFNSIENNDTQSATVTYTITDSDTDSNPNFLELDSDNDGCNDVVEAGFTDNNADGILGDNPVTENTNGIVTSGTDGYTDPGTAYTDNSVSGPNPGTLTVSIGTSVCVGESGTITSTVTGGTFSSNDASVVNINASTGAINALSAGTATITYSVTGGGCTSTVTQAITVNPLPTFTASPTNPTSCGASDGSITLTGLLNSTNYEISTNNGTTFNPETSDGSGEIDLTGLSAGSYDIIVRLVSTSCESSSTNVVLADPGAPTAAINASSTSITVGATVTLTASGGGNYLWSPGGETTAAISVSPTSTTTYTVAVESGGCTDFENVTITVNTTPPTTPPPSPNRPPIAVDDTRSVPEDGGPLNSSVVGNDRDPDGDPLTFTLISSGTAEQNGTLIFNPNGFFSFTPDPNFNGPVTFTYRACDPSGLCDDATVTINVEPVEDPPVATDDFNCSDEEATQTANVGDNDSDPEGGELTYELIDGSAVEANGTFTFNVNGSYTFVPNPNFSGNITFTYRVCDPSNTCNTATATVCIVPLPDAPVAINDTLTTPEDTPITSSVGGNDADPDGDPLTYSVTDGGTAEENGTLTFNEDGTFTFTPNPNFNGTVTFTYRVCDTDGLCDTAEVTITVTPVPDSPIAENDTIPATEDTPITSSVVGNDSDPDGDPLTYSLINSRTAEENGTLTFNEDGTFTFEPDPNFNGTVTFTYQACDPSGLCDEAEVTIIVAPIPDLPVAENDTVTTPEDTPITSSVGGNDSDPDGDPLTYTITDGGTAEENGTLTFNEDGTFTFVPNPDFNGTVTFTYQVCDSSGLCDEATVTLTIAPVNDQPIAENDTLTTLEDVPVTGSVVGNDSDPEGSPLTYSLTDGGTAEDNGTLAFNEDGTFTFESNPDFNGTVTFTYQACDEGAPVLCDEATVTIVVAPINDPPIAEDDTYTIPEDSRLVQSVIFNDHDPEGLLLTFELLEGGTAEENGTLTFQENGSFTFEPAPDFHGTVTFTYQACDSEGLCDEATVTIVVEPVNDPPVAVNDTVRINEDEIISSTVATNDSDPDGDLLVYELSLPGNTGQHGELTFNEDGTFTFVPEEDFNGTVTFSYRVCDTSGACDLATVTLIIEPVNDPPRPEDDTNTTREGYSVVGNVLKNDTDPEGDSLTVEVGTFTGTEGGTLILTENGDYEYTPAPDFSGTECFEYVVCDDGGACATATLCITVTPNQPPIAENDQNSTPESTPVDGNLGSNDTDPESDALTWTEDELITQNGNTVIIRSDGTYTFTPIRGFIGEDCFTYEVCDALGACDTAEVCIDVVSSEELFIPEGFSPNNDGVNDSFIIEGLKGRKTVFRVYNRWGNLMYENDDYKNDWMGLANRGIRNGEELPDGTYFYIIEIDGIRERFSRYFTLRR